MLEITRTCPGAWTDFNGHMRDAYYVLMVSFANDAAMAHLGLGPDYLRATGRTLYNLDSRTRYLKEAHAGQVVLARIRPVDHDARRVHFHVTVADAKSGAALAICEEVLLHVDQAGGPRAEDFPAAVAARLSAWAEEAGPAPEARTGGVGLRRRT